MLKPVDDTRMRGKFAQTLLAEPLTEVHIAGRGTAGDLPQSLAQDSSRLHHHRIFGGSRLSLNRLAAQGRYWRLLRGCGPTW
ncbi:hypothetical protein [Hymenobacter sp. BRD67]|uniref:hypothetical protein n=1 Tax=Hymenobacter sp. BRD67 TaxID=2675877 RepID=UPI001563BDAA|nr:hypothetical protein [Hymenobacter sp. BRD67]QKG52143.1 hypothetical protein GKZ67_05385 [Hymenobacter sp. BRD67]